MVYFNCAKCGTGLKKAQVEQHMFQCRSRLVSCIDCQKDFKDAEFKGHLTCMTESERYESKDYVAKANKGDLKQTAWIEKISQAVSVFRGSAKAKSMLEKLVEYPNVPRKKPKFINFVRNSFRYLAATDAQIEEIWTVIEAFDKKTPPPPPKPQNQQTTPEKPSDTNTSLPQKRKFDDCNDDDNNLTPEFDWLEEIKRICLKKDSNTIDLGKLQKKLYKRYKKHKNGGADENRCESSTNGHSTETKNVENDDNDENEEKFKKKLNKKLKKLNNSDSSSISLISNHNGDQSIMVVVKYLNNNNSNSNDE